MASALLHEDDLENAMIEDGDAEAGDDDWDDFEGEEESLQYHPLFSPQLAFSTLDEAISADKVSDASVFSPDGCGLGGVGN
jgi:hypothetical protein